MAATIKDVARRAGVSIATISKFINGGTVRHANRLHIEEAIEALGYKVNGMARGLKTSRTMTVGVLIPDLEIIFCTSIVSRVESILQTHGYSTLICDYRQDPFLEKEKMMFLADRQVDGLLMMPLAAKAEDIQMILERKIPVVLLDRPVQGLACDAVLSDNLHASYEAVERLIVAGHKRIGLVNGPPDIHTAMERLKGYLRAHEDHDVIVNNQYVRDGGYDTEGGYHETCTLIEMDEPPTAILVTNHEMTTGAVMALNERNIRIPEALSFIGFDNHTLTRIIKPPLSIVVQPITEIATAAAELLVRRMRGDVERTPTLLRLKTTLLEKSSVGAPVNK